MTNFAGWLDELFFFFFEKLSRVDGISARPAKMNSLLPGAERVIRAFQRERRCERRGT